MSTVNAGSKDSPVFDHAQFIEHGPREPIDLEYADDLEDQVGKLKEESIIFVLKQADSSESGYVVFSLTDETEQSNGKLSCLLAPSLPDQILQKHLLPKIPDHLRCDAAHPVTVVVSTHSGLCRAGEFYKGVVQPLLAAVGLAPRTSEKDGYEVIVTKNENTIKALGKRLWEESTATDISTKKTIVLLSGDGGVVDLLNASDDHSIDPDSFPDSPRPTIVLFPMGTGNALFHSLHKPLYTPSSSHHVVALRTLFQGVPAPLPIFQASFSQGARLISYSDPKPEPSGEAEEHSRSVTRLLGAIVASYGFHASLVWESDTPAYRKHGDKRFGMAAAELLKLGHGYEADVRIRRDRGADAWETPSFTEEGRRVGYALATLVSNLEKTFTISPASRPLDGKLRLVGFGDVDGEKTMDVMKAAYSEGAHVGMKWTGEDGKEEGVGYDEVTEVRVVVREENARWRKVCVDGTIVEVPQDGWMRVARAKERFDVVVDPSVV